MPVNVELLRETLDYIENHREEWDQEEWRCGTTMCFAGHAVITISGGRWAAELPEYPDAGPFTVVMPDGSYGSVESIAHRLLDFPYGDSLGLFYLSTNIESVRETVAALIEIGEKENQADAHQR